MMTEELYQLAFQYRKTRLWNVLSHRELFALQLADGQIGYCSVVGRQEGMLALMLYVGEQGFASCRRLLLHEKNISKAEIIELIEAQECLLCLYENKEELTETRVADVKQYLKAHDIKLHGSLMFPEFLQYRPFCCPLELSAEQKQEQEQLCQALTAAIALSEKLQTTQKAQLGFADLTAETREIPYLTPQDGDYSFQMLQIPTKFDPPQYPKPQLKNELLAAKLKRAKKRGVWGMEVFRASEMIMSPEEGILRYPVMLMIIDLEQVDLLAQNLYLDYDERAAAGIVEELAALMQNGRIPQAIQVQDQRTAALLENLCRQTGIKLQLQEEIAILQEIKEGLARNLEHMEDYKPALSDDELREWLTFLSEEDIRSLPDGLKQDLLNLIGTGELPVVLEERLQRALLYRETADTETGAKKKRRKKKPVSKAECQTSYVISVSLGRGCYRHLRISAASTLFKLHEEILNAFNFEDDHAHVFFLDNRRWSRDRACYGPGMGEGKPETDQVYLEQLGWTAGDKFLYIFDFGDDWTFSCRVLKVLDEPTKEPFIVRTKGEAPEQYPDVEEDWEGNWNGDQDDE